MNAEAVARQIEKIHGEEVELGKPELRFVTFGYRKSQLSSFDFLYNNNEQAQRNQAGFLQL